MSIQVINRPTEDEMSAARTMFERMSNALVQASDLSHLVADMDVRVREMESGLEALRRRNAELDGLLHDVRRQRDDAEANLTKAKDELNAKSAEADSLRYQLTNTQADLQRANDTIAVVRKERDDAQLHVMELEDKVKSLQAQVEKVQGFFRDLFPVAVPPAEPPQPAPSAGDPPQSAQPQYGNVANW